MNDTFKISPLELQCIINAAMKTIEQHPDKFPIAKEKSEELTNWLSRTIWDNPESPDLIIMERPF